MKISALLGLSVALSFFTGCGGGSAPTTRYVITDLGGNFGASLANAVNNVGQVIGQGTYSYSGIPQSSVSGGSGPGSATSFLYANGKVVTLKDNGVTAINDRGQIVGYSGEYHDGEVTPLPSLATSKSGNTVSLHAGGINNQGQIVGFSDVGVEEESHTVHAALYANGQVTDLGTLGEPPAGSSSPPGSSYATAINDSGQIVGYSTTSAVRTGVYAKYHALLWQGGHMSDLGTLGGDSSFAVAINANGLIVGNSTPFNSGTSHAVYWQNGQIHDLQGSGPDVNATGVNDSGQIVGAMHVGLNNVGYSLLHAFVYEKGRFTDLNTQIPANSGWELNDAHAINNRGQICGSGTYKGVQRAYLLTPQ